MTHQAIEQKDKIQILLAEYASLRSELNARITSMYVVAGWTTVAIIWLLQQEYTKSFWLGLTIWAIGTVYSARILVHDMANAGRRAREIENEINRRAEEKLLLWENELGGLTSSYWLRLLSSGRFAKISK